MDYLGGRNVIASILTQERWRQKKREKDLRMETESDAVPLALRMKEGGREPRRAGASRS